MKQHFIVLNIRELRILYQRIPTTSQKAGLTGLYKNFLFMSTMAISKPGFQEVDITVIPVLTFIKE